MSRAESITEHLRKYDRQLYAIKEERGIISIFRRCREYRQELISEGVYILNVVENPYRVMSLTDTWTLRGKSIDWGIEPLMARIRAMDLWNSGLGVEELKLDHEKAEKSKERSFSNSVESFLYDFKGALARDTKDVNTSNLNKIDKRREGDKKLWL